MIIKLYKTKTDVCVITIAGYHSLPTLVRSRVIVNRPATRLESTFPDSKCRFRSGRGTTDMLFAATQVQEKCREQNLDLCMVFVDVTKPFDSVSREGLWKL